MCFYIQQYLYALLKCFLLLGLQCIFGVVIVVITSFSHTRYDNRSVLNITYSCKARFLSSTFEIKVKIVFPALAFLSQEFPKLFTCDFVNPSYPLTGSYLHSLDGSHNSLYIKMYIEIIKVHAELKSHIGCSKLNEPG